MESENFFTKYIYKSPSEVKISGLNRRFFNFLIDYLPITIVFDEVARNGSMTDADELLVIPLGFMVYFILFECVFGKTPGKFFTRTKVIEPNTGKKPTVGKTIIRTISRFIPFEIFSFLSSRPRGWHDRISKTIVVEESPVDWKKVKYYFCFGSLSGGWYRLATSIQIILLPLFPLTALISWISEGFNNNDLN